MWNINVDRLIDRMIRAARLDVDLYEEVEADTEALRPAIVVVVLSSLAAGVGQIGTQGVSGILLGTLGALIGWVIWAYLTYIIGTRILPEPQTESDFGELLRTIGFSSAPGVLRLFGFIPALGPVVVFGSAVWMLVAMVVAVRQALDYESTPRAVGVCAIGWVVQMVLVGLVLSTGLL